jgi:hypothetical protein
VVIISIYGYTLFGRVDRVPGLFHVATQFLHVYWMPILPKRSMLVLEMPSGEGRAVLLPLSWKSILLAWGRFLIMIAGCVVLPFGIGVNLPDLPDRWARVAAIMMLSMPIMSMVLIGVSYALTRAKASRAIELARIAGIPPEEIARRFVGQLRPEDEELLRRAGDRSMIQSNDSSRG